MSQMLKTYQLKSHSVFVIASAVHEKIVQIRPHHTFLRTSVHRHNIPIRWKIIRFDSIPFTLTNRFFDSIRFDSTVW